MTVALLHHYSQSVFEISVTDLSEAAQARLRDSEFKEETITVKIRLCQSHEGGWFIPVYEASESMVALEDLPKITLSKQGSEATGQAFLSLSNGKTPSDS